MKAEKVYETFEMPNNKKLGRKTVLTLGMTLLAVILMVIGFIFGQEIDTGGNAAAIVITKYAFNYWYVSAPFIFVSVCLLIFKWAKR